MCSGRVDAAFLLKAFTLGADGVMIAGCHPGDCHYIEQNYKTIRRHVMLRYVLESMGIDGGRLRLVWASAAEGQILAESIDRFVADIRGLGPLELARQLGGKRPPHRGPGRDGRRTRRGDGGAEMSEEKQKGKLALYWAASCGGCEIAVLALNEKILDVAAAFDIVLWPVAIDAKVRDVENMADGSINVCLFNGGIRTSEQEYMAQLLRRKSKVLVAFGSCARGLHSRAGQHQQPPPDFRHRLPPNALDRESRWHRAAARDADAGGDAPSAGLLRHAPHARPDRAGRLLPARLPARGRPHLGRHYGHRRGQAAAAGLGNRRQDDRLP